MVPSTFFSPLSQIYSVKNKGMGIIPVPCFCFIELFLQILYKNCKQTTHLKSTNMGKFLNTPQKSPPSEHEFSWKTLVSVEALMITKQL